MMQRRTCLFLLCILLTAAFTYGCATMTPEERERALVQDGAEKLSGPAMREAFAGATLYDENGGWAVYVDPDGSQRFKNLRRSFSDTGQWEIRGDAWCSTWGKIRRGATACFTTFRKGETFMQVKEDGSMGQSFTRTPGNPEDL